MYCGVLVLQWTTIHAFVDKTNTWIYIYILICIEYPIRWVLLEGNHSKTQFSDQLICIIQLQSAYPCGTWLFGNVICNPWTSSLPHGCWIPHMMVKWQLWDISSIRLIPVTFYLCFPFSFYLFINLFPQGFLLNVHVACCMHGWFLVLWGFFQGRPSAHNIMHV